MIFAVGLLFAFQNLFEQKRLIDKESRINLWFLAQLEIEYLRLLETLNLFYVDGSGLEADEVQLRFEIFWSRLPVMLDGDRGTAFRVVPGFADTISNLLETVSDIEPLIANLDSSDRTNYETIRGQLEQWRTPLHHLVLDALTFESTATQAHRRKVGRLYYEMVGFSVATYLGIVLLFLALYREIRKTSIAEHRASAARAQLVEAIESISEAFVLFDDKDRIVLHNTKYQHFYPDLVDAIKVGATFEDLARLAVARRLVSPPSGDVERWIRASVENHRNPTLPIERELSDGRWLRISERRTKHGWIVGVHTDITELKRREVELRNKTGLLEATLENITQGICVLDTELRVIAWNMVFVEMFEFAGELISKDRPFGDFIRHCADAGEYGPFATDEDAEAAVRQRVDVIRDIATGRVEHAREERRRPNGTTIDVTYNAMPDGGLVVTFTDLTERVRAEEERSRLADQFHAAQEENLRLMMERESAQRRSAESRLSAAIESSSEAIILLDADNRIVIANTQAKQLLPGLGRLLEPGSPYPEALLEPSGSAPRLGDAPADTTPEPDDAGEPRMAVEVQVPDGRWFRVSRSTGQDAVSVIIWSDISEIKQREENLRQAKELAEAASASKTNFLTSMSHELRTPLNAIIGFSEIMSNQLLGPLTPRYKNYADDIRRSGLHLLDIITDILDFAKSEEGRLQLRVQPVDVAGVIDTCGRIMREQCDHAGLSLTIDVAADLSQILADMGKLRQIVLNLMSNAVKFTPSGGSVTVKASAAPDGGIDLQISDSGIGMRPADIPTALQPFCQIDSSLARKYEGTGLGLPLTQKLVLLHGGTLEITSELGAGTTVAVHLPPEPPGASTASTRPTAPAGDRGADSDLDADDRPNQKHA